MSSKNDKPVMYNGDFIRDSSGAKRIMNAVAAQRQADREAKRSKSFINARGMVRDDNTHYTIYVTGGIRG